jgi:hypothetical protein
MQVAPLPRVRGARYTHVLLPSEYMDESQVTHAVALVQI